ncbi:hypothetical protein [Magnetospirillum gryphiswaldense]|nr:hypothetical protein [Magnetospirillum gryphiswaldense]
MWSLASKRLGAALAAAAGIATTAMPLTYQAGPAVLALALAGGWAMAGSRTGRLAWTVLSAVLLGLVLAGHANATLTAALAAVAALTQAAPLVPIALAILLAQTAAASSGTALLGGALHPIGLEATAPALVCLLTLGLVYPRQAVVILLAAMAVVGAAAGVSHWASVPEASIAAAGAVATIVAVTLALRPSPPQSLRNVLVLTALVGAMVTWAWTLPRAHDLLYVLLPAAPTAYAAKFFQHYGEALGFAGITTTVVATPADIPERAMVLLPWLTDPLPGGDEQDWEIGRLARERSWTVVLGGEHTNMGGAANRVGRITGRELLRRDLSVPPRNTDDNGPMRAADLREWRHDAILNRGASVPVLSLTNRVLLAGDGWWAEPDIGEWLWVGDYLWRPGDRAGRLTMAAAFDDGRARWVVVGDNSLLVNRQVIADPRPVLQLLEASTLWPAFLRDLALLAVAALVLWRRRPVIVLVLAAALPVASYAFAGKPSDAWRGVYRGESGFDERNFNEALAQEPKLLGTDWRLLRVPTLRGLVDVPIGKTVLFGLVDGSAEIGGVRLSNCRRLGSMPTGDIMLMDAQACRVEGPAEVLVGTAQSAAAIHVKTRDDSSVLVVLDAAFLSQKASAKNRQWLVGKAVR